MRALLVSVLAMTGCSGILGIPSEGSVGCPEPCTVTVSGRTVRAESLGASQQALPNVTVTLTSVDPPIMKVSGADGSYSFAGLAPGTALEFKLAFTQDAPVPQGLLDTRYDAGTTGESNIALDLPVVQYRWMAQVSVDCGIFPTLNDALFEPGTTSVNTYFTTRSTIVGNVLKDDGTAAPLDRSDIGVTLGSFLNFNQNPSDSTNPPPAAVCFLEPDSLAGEFKGVNADHSTFGRFILFRARNNLGTGTGVGDVRIAGFPPGPLNVATGTVGFSRIKHDEGEPLPPRPKTFERDVYHFFADKTCSTVCHRPPDGIGFTTAPARPGPGGLTYRADWSASVDEVFDNLTKPFDTDCSLGGATVARVCKAKPDASLLYTKPGGLPPEHAGLNLGTDDEMVVTVLQWITDGAILR